ncbi:Alpha-N-methyltransferase NTM1, partial [Trinorchestia longiramus]
TSEESSAGNGVPEPSDASTIDVNDKIDYGQASLYWKAVPATVNGMLGGFAHISSTDINGSSALIKWIFNQKEKPGHGRCVDCGAGIGRITQRLLQKHFGKVDLVEQSPEFVEKAKEIFASNSKIGEIYCMGLQDFTPSPGIYDVVWTQWVLGYLRDDDLITFFRRMSESLKPNGVLVVKENFTTECDGIPAHTVLDSEDSSVTRPLAILLKLASAAGLNLLRMVQQRRFPKQLYKVYMLVFKPER